MINIKKPFRYEKKHWDILEAIKPFNAEMWKSNSKDIRTIKSHIKSQLDRKQEGRCVYCQCIITGARADIEHFAPKGAGNYPQFMFHNKNLFLSCQICNREDKKKYDVVEIYSSKYKYNIFNIVHPLFDNVSEHFTLEKETFVLKPLTKKAENTKKVLKLNDLNKIENRIKADNYDYIETKVKKFGKSREEIKELMDAFLEKHFM